MIRTVGTVMLCALAVVAVAPTGSPVQLSYVYSDSMEPTIGVDDGYVLVPAGRVDLDDVVTFWSDHHDAYVTHRVVGSSERGFITQGDNNPTPDQAAGHPHVQRDDIVGEVATVGGKPVVIPHLGTVVGLARENVALLLAGCAFSLLWSVRSPPNRPVREVTRVNDWLRPVLVAGFVALAVTTALGAPTTAETFVTVAHPTGAPATAGIGESTPVEYLVAQPSIPGTRRVVHADGWMVESVQRNASALVVSGHVPGRETTGVTRTTFSVYRLSALLPASVARQLLAIHPLVGAAASALTIVGPLALLATALVDGSQPVRSSRTRLWHQLNTWLEAER